MTTTTTIIFYTGVSPRVAFGVNANCSCSRSFCFIWVNANCSYPSTALSFILRCETVIGFYWFLSYFITNFIYVLSLFVRSSAKLPMIWACFIVNFSRIFEKHALIVLLSNWLDDCSSCRFDGLWKLERDFRLASVELSAVFFLLILSVIMVTITITKT